MRKKINYSELNVFEKIISIILKKYTYKIYSSGVKDGYNWAKNKSHKKIKNRST